MASDPPEESPGQDRLSRFNTNVPHPARVYDAWLGGKDNYAADRAAAEAGLEAFPSTVKSVRANRAFLARTVEYLVAEAGIHQFLDVGTGLPSANNTHEVAQAILPESRIAYVDNDPIVLAHAQALLRGTESGATDYIDADLRDPGKILQEASRTLDFTRPVAVMLIAVLHFIPDDADPQQIVDTLMAAVPPGSHLVVSHTAKDIFPEEMAAFERAMNANTAEKVTLRDRDQVSGFFRGLDLIEPGVVQVPRWRPRSDLEASAPAVLWGGMARKPA
ncbi:SAM-dependent methyltransferase [Actinomadura darangshiensis]|uniref:SAM-dependent methyltransferase n=1 Tax=Actinomadura darangshiensis TaxID=705336 RepID=A0A4R4ZWE3_9ACTN|nr:SAM-dependent methyltransferase [Actinomadura darangshiensis]TDD63588.1 SAM-dependent methyltransferase [Actinomadura darangshiensis]